MPTTNTRSHAARGIENERKTMKKIIAIALLLATSLALAHSGGTDSNGCHQDHKTGTRHCH
jgi:hydrogenase/urease accessory protein HupE